MVNRSYSELRFKRVQENYIGEVYSCRAFDSEKKEIGNQKLTLSSYPIIHIGGEKTSFYFLEGQAFTLNCSTWGYPKPSAKWLFSNSILKSKLVSKSMYRNEYIYRAINIDEKSKGEYKCISENKLSTSSIEVSVEMRERKTIEIATLIYFTEFFIILTISLIVEGINSFREIWNTV